MHGFKASRLIQLERLCTLRELVVELVERRIRKRVVWNVEGSSRVLPMTFYQYHIPRTVPFLPLNLPLIILAL